MKHNVKQLFVDADALVTRYRVREGAFQKQWVEENLEDWRPLRDMITTKLRRKEVITIKDIKSVLSGSTDLDRWYGGSVSGYRGSLGVIARLRQNRPRNHIDVYFSDLVGFRDLVATLPGEEVTDQELSDLGYSRFPAVVSRLTRCDDEHLGLIQEIY